ncbi:hypothetical protein VCHA53O466_50376 [Vibrio chagasii]|nr:hypothetical protein VCHA53O466_50376 [Vibrio chagasii]
MSTIDPLNITIPTTKAISLFDIPIFLNVLFSIAKPDF